MFSEVGIKVYKKTHKAANSKQEFAALCVFIIWGDIQLLFY